MFSSDGTMFGTFGEELSYIHNCIGKIACWTLTEEDGEMFIKYGCHFVNRIGYFLTSVIPSNIDEIDIIVEL